MSALFAKNVYLLLFLPTMTALLLAVVPKLSPVGARINIVRAFLTFLAALSLFLEKPGSGRYLLVDDLNIVFVVLNTFVAFTTSVFSASYIAHEIETGRLTTSNLRYYHTMYQVLLGAMNLALVANNIGLMWVAIEVATLTTVLMVGIYRTDRALAASQARFAAPTPLLVSLPPRSAKDKARTRGRTRGRKHGRGPGRTARAVARRRAPSPFPTVLLTPWSPPSPLAVWSVSISRHHGRGDGQRLPAFWPHLPRDGCQKSRELGRAWPDRARSRGIERTLPGSFCWQAATRKIALPGGREMARRKAVINSAVLVLNRHFQPIHVTNVKEGFLAPLHRRGPGRGPALSHLRLR